MQKLITFAVPAYNAEGYLRTCLESLLKGGEEVEIVIIDDGSTDATGTIADEYASRYPSVVRTVHQPNGGHGAGVNAGLACAEGLYYKVVDSDDWLDEAGLKKLLACIRAHLRAGTLPDLYIADFVYEHVQDKTRYISSFRKKLPEGRLFSWEETRPLRLWKVLLMHALVYRTQLVREHGVPLPRHTFYVDHLFAYAPFPYAERIFYLGCTLYHYFIGRSDQSVTIENVVRRYGQQIRVMSLIFKAHSSEEFRCWSRPLRRQMSHYLDAFLMNTYFFTTAKDTPERRQAFGEMWAELKENDIALWRRVRRLPKVALLNALPWKLRGKVATAAYLFLCKHVKLGL